VPRDSEEAMVEREWGFERYDAGAHSLFLAFQQHLASHPCWKALDRAKYCFRKYEDACEQAHAAVCEKVRDWLQDLAEPEITAMTSALLTDAYCRTSVPSDIVEFRPRPQSIQHEDGVRWHLPVGSGLVGNVADPTELKPLAVAYEELTRVLPSIAELTSLADADRTAGRTINDFRQLLGPDSQLRNMILEGHCDICPRTADH